MKGHEMIWNLIDRLSRVLSRDSNNRYFLADPIWLFMKGMGRVLEGELFC